MDIINGEKLTYRYGSADRYAIRDVDIRVKKGGLVAILGHNGSGKSTLVKHINALLLPQSGSLTVDGIDVTSKADVFAIRRKAGMVFQNPDNQFVSSVVEDDVAFGLENYLVSREEIPGLVTKALERVGMEGYEKHSPQMLSGGQKQRVAIAGVLAVDPEILIFDEATAMLDPEGRSEVLDIIRKLHATGEKTILMVTHYVEESIMADRIILMKEGRVLAEGTPEEILTDEKLMAESGLMPPASCRIYSELKRAGYELDSCPLTEAELVETICRY
ncbi:MAG: energy-coupling factor transporter ATPase [Bacillota bacterium]|nr:energy-coupling factor transporter ATPase [Bacillota bacterium]